MTTLRVQGYTKLIAPETRKNLEKERRELESRQPESQSGDLGTCNIEDLDFVSED